MHFDFNTSLSKPRIDSTMRETANTNNGGSENKQSINDAKAVNKTLPEDTITISDEAIKKQQQEDDAALDEKRVSKGKTPQELAEEMKQKLIDDLKKRIEKVSEELQKLKGKQDDVSLEQAKLLQNQLNQLNGQLFTMLS